MMTDGNKIALQAVAETTVEFADDFIKVVANDKPGNLIASPLSAQVVLAMATYGAGGTNAAQMRSALHVPGDDALGQSGYQSLIESLNAPKGVDLRLANKIWISIRSPVKPGFKELTTNKFFSSSQEVDFNDAEGTARTINAWGGQQTNNRIQDIVAPENFDQDTVLVLVNAVYFKGQWQHKFNPTLTRNRAFHVNRTTISKIPTMFVKTRLRFGDLAEVNSRFIEIPYQGGEISMIIILPNYIDGLEMVKDNLHKVNLGQSLRKNFATEVELFLPKFKMEITLDLGAALEKLGMTEMFQNNADFSGISDEPLKISKVIQKAFIEVNEEGTEAAAVTVMGTMFGSAPQPRTEVFRVDHPFYYQIRSTTLNVPLFAGFYTAPK